MEKNFFAGQKIIAYIDLLDFKARCCIIFQN